MTTRFLQGESDDGGMWFAAFDPSAHHVAGQVCKFRFSASLVPFASENAARAALEASGAEIVVEVGR